MRHEKLVTIGGDKTNRDAGKTFRIEEQPAGIAEDWFLRACMLLSRAGADVPPELFQQGLAGFAAMSIGAILNGVSKAQWMEVKPLLDEMMSCVSMRTPAMTFVSGPMMDTQIEEVSTRLLLRQEVADLHLGFSTADRLSHFRNMAAMMIAMSTADTQTSPAGSE